MHTYTASPGLWHHAPLGLSAPAGPRLMEGADRPQGREAVCRMQV